MKNSTSLKGHLKRPLLLMIINIGYLIFPIINLFFILPPMIYFFKALQIGVRVNFITSFIVWEQFVLLFVVSIIVAVLLYKMNKVSWWAVLIHSGLIFLHNIFIFTILHSLSSNNYFNIILSTIFELVTISIVVYFVVIRKQFREIFFNKRLRWWESKTRYLINVEVDIILKNGESIKANIKDISIGGICAILTNEKSGVDPKDFKSISFEYDNLKFLSDIIVIWEDKNKFGFSFSNYNTIHKKQIKKIIARLKKNKKNKEGR